MLTIHTPILKNKQKLNKKNTILTVQMWTEGSLRENSTSQLSAVQNIFFIILNIFGTEK